MAVAAKSSSPPAKVTMAPAKSAPAQAKVTVTASSARSTPKPASDHGDIFRNLIRNINTLAATPDFRAVSSMLDETVYLRQQLRDKEERLAKKETAITEFLATNQSERAKEVNRLQRQVDEARAAAEEGKKNVAQSAKDTSALQKKLKECEKNIGKMKTDESALKQALSAASKKNKELEDAQHALSETLKNKNKELEGVKQAQSEAMKKSNKELEDVQKALSEATKNNRELEDVKQSLSRGVEDAQKRLWKLEGFCAKRTELEEEQMLGGFAGLWDYAATELSPHLDKDLSKEVLQNNAAWEKLRRKTELNLRHHVRLSPSNSPAAKRMRLAVFLAALSREINKHIFQPTYIFPQDDQLRNVLNQLAETDHEKESFCRSLLVSINHEAQMKELQSRIQFIAATVTSYLSDFLPENRFLELRVSVENVLKRAADVWSPIQRAVLRYEPDFEPTRWKDYDWEPFGLPNQDPSEYELVPGVAQDVLLTVFPRISLVKDGGRSPWNFVVHLVKAQKMCTDAEKEMVQTPASPAVGRRASNRPRRRSTAPQMNGASGQPSANAPGAGSKK